MSTCNHTITLGNGTKQFNSEKELDTFLKQYYHILAGEHIPSDLEYSAVLNGKTLTPAEEIWYKLRGLKIPVAKIVYDEYGIRREKTGGMSVSKTIEEFARAKTDKGLIYFNEANYRENRFTQIQNALQAKDIQIKDPDILQVKSAYDDLVAKYGHETNYLQNQEFNKEKDVLINTLINNTIGNWKLLGLFGSNIHGLAESYFGYKLENKDVEVPDYHYTMFKGDLVGITDIGKRNYLKYLKQLETTLLSKHGQNAIIIPEFKLHDEKVGENGLTGIIDLLVIDEKGLAHIYDFKTSYKDTTDWTNAKVLSTKYQLLFYRNMLQNKGIQVDSMSYIPITMRDIDFANQTIGKLDPNEIQRVRSFDITRKMEANVNNMCPRDHTAFYESTPESAKIGDQLKAAWGYEIKLKASFANVAEFKKKYVRPDINDPENKVYFMDQETGLGIHVDKDKVDEAVEKYLKKVSINAASHLQSFKNELRKVIAGEATINSVNFSKNSKIREERVSTVVQRAFQKYLDGSWDIVMNNTILDQQGIIMFINKKGDTAEFVSYTTNDLEGMNKLKHGNSILGNFLRDKEVEAYSGILGASNKNLELLKVMFYLNSNFKIPYKIGNIKVFNKDTLEFHTEPLEKLKFNFNFLCRKMELENRLGNLEMANKTDILYDRLASLMSEPAIIDDYRKNLENSFKILGDNQNPTRLKALYKIQEDLRLYLAANEGLETISHFSSGTQQLMGMISEAIVAEERYQLPFELDIKEFTTNSLNFSDPHNMPSEIAKKVVSIFDNASFLIRKDQQAFQNGVVKLVCDKFLEDQGYGAIRRGVVGDYMKAYSNLFVVDTITGKRDPRMILKDPYNPKSDLTNVEREFSKFFLGHINKIRYGTDDIHSEIGEEKITTGEWFNLPLIKGTAVSNFINKSARQDIKEMADSLLDVENLFSVQREKTNKLIGEGMFHMINSLDFQLNPEARNELLQKTAIGSFETDLETVVNMMHFVETRKNRFNEVLPLINAIKIATLFQAREMNVNLPNLEKFITDYMMSTAYSKLNIKEETKTTLKTVMAVKKMATFLNMSLNVTTGLNQLFQGHWSIYVRLLAKSGGEHMFNYADYKKAFNYVLKDGLSSIESVTTVEALNQLYGINEISLEHIVDKFKVNRGGLLSMRSGGLYWTSIAPDYFNRMVMFVAQLHKDGSFEAHSMKDGVLVYDFKKDKRFSAFTAGLTSDPLYKDQKALYQAMRNALNAEGLSVKDGEDLPVAYTNQQRNSLKDFSDSVRGHYDTATKIRANNMILGTMFLQFKNWLVAKKNQYFLQSGEGAQGNFEHLIIDGQKYYLDEHGMPTTVDTGEPLYQWKGRMMEGIYQSLKKMYNEVLDAKGHRWATFTHLTDGSAIRKSNLKLLAYDVTSMMIMFILLGLFDLKDMKSSQPLAYNALHSFMRMPSDESVGSHVKAFLNPSPFASMSYLGEAMTGLWQVIGGHKGVLAYTTSTIGATRIISPWVKELEKAAK